jgi:hypothetical protein
VQLKSVDVDEHGGTLPRGSRLSQVGVMLEGEVQR